MSEPNRAASPIAEGDRVICPHCRGELDVVLEVWMDDPAAVFATARRRPRTLRRQVIRDTTRGVYCLRVPGFIKIGVATCVVKRADNLQTGSPHTLEPLGFRPTDTMVEARDIERFVHDHLTAWHVRGEWFEDVPEVVGYVSDWLEPWPASVVAVAVEEAQG